MQMNRMSPYRALAALALSFVLVTMMASAAAAQVVGRVATLDGTVEIDRAGTTLVAAAGFDVEKGDVVRTGTGGRIRLLLRDDTVVNLGASSTLTLDEQVLGDGATPPQSMLQLLGGKLRVLVSEVYAQPDAEFEVKTLTAVSGVRGTEFIVTYDAAVQATEVIGISGKVEVNGFADLESRGVFVRAREVTRVDEDGVPSPPQRLEDELFRQYLDGLAFIGRGQPEGAVIEHPFLGTEFVPAIDQVEAVVQAAIEAGQPVPQAGDGEAAADAPVNFDTTPILDASDLVGQPPAAVVETGEIGIRF
jgi:opacity protein-like surface antigen